MALSVNSGINIGFLLRRSVQLLCQHRSNHPDAGRSRSIIRGSHTRALYRESFVHDRTSTSNELQIGDGTPTRGMVSGGRQRSKSCGRCLFEKRAHSLGLMEESFHGGQAEPVSGSALSFLSYEEERENGEGGMRWGINYRTKYKHQWSLDFWGPGVG